MSTNGNDQIEQSVGPAGGDENESLFNDDQFDDAPFEDDGVPDEPEPAEPGAEPRRRRRRPRRVALTPSGTPLMTVINQAQPSNKPPPPPRKKPGPIEQAANAAREEWERELAKFTDSVAWTLERIGPHTWDGKRVPLGTVPDEFHGPCNAAIIGDIAGGGKYMVHTEDHNTGRCVNIGPVTVLGAPKFDLGVAKEEEERMPFGPPLDWRAGAYFRRDREEDEDQWVRVHDPRLGWVMRRKSDVERDDRRINNDPIITQLQFQMKEQGDAFKKVTEESSKQIAELAKLMSDQVTAHAAAQATPREDPATKWLQIQMQQLEADKQAKAAELQYMREKLTADQRFAEAARKHEAEMWDKKIEAERDRARVDKEALETRLSAERDRIAEEKKMTEARLVEIAKLSESKIEKANATMLEMVREKSNPMEQVVGLLGMVREISDVIGLGGDKEKNGEGEDDGRPKTGAEKIVSVLGTGVGRLWGVFEPVVKKAVQSYLDQQIPQAAMQGISPQALPAPDPSLAHPTVRQDKPKPAQPQSEDPTKLAHELGKVIHRLNGEIDRNYPARSAWRELLSEMPERAAQMQYNSLDDLIAELRMMPFHPALAMHADAINALADKLAGPKRAWGEEFLAAAHESRRAG